MATPFSSIIPGLVTIRVYRTGEHALVRVWIGKDGMASLTGELTMTREDWRQFRALLPAHDPQHLAIHYANGEVFDWLTSPAEVVPL